MDLTLILGVCIISAAAAVLLRQYKPEYVLPVTLAAGGFVLVYTVSHIGQALLSLQNKVSALGLDISYFYTAAKALGICLVTGFIADACRDTGQNTLASKAELAGRCAIFIMSLPLLSSLLDIALGFVT